MDPKIASSQHLLRAGERNRRNLAWLLSGTMQKRLSIHPRHARHIWRWLENQYWIFMFPSPLRIYLPASSSSHVHYVNWSWKKELGLSTLEASNCRKSTPHKVQPAYAVPFHIEIYEAKDLCINSSYGCTGSWISSITCSATPLRAPSYYQHHYFLMQYVPLQCLSTFTGARQTEPCSTPISTIQITAGPRSWCSSRCSRYQDFRIVRSPKKQKYWLSRNSSYSSFLYISF